MITVTAMKWAPPFAAGMVRDHRARWILKEVGWPYRVALVDAPHLKSLAYRQRQPFGQVPLLEEDGRPPLFESGAILLDVAMRSGRLIAGEGMAERSQAVQWVVAGLNSIEPFLMNVAEVEFFLEDEEAKARRRPAVLPLAHERLAALEQALGTRDWLVGDGFTVADLTVASILRIAGRLDLLADHRRLRAWHEKILARPACREAEADQLSEMREHTQADMRQDAVADESSA